MDKNWKSIKDMQDKALLNTQSISDSLTYPSNKFHSLLFTIADIILNKTVLTVDFNRKYRILECEFYLNDFLIHQDTYTSDIIRN